MSDSRSGSSVGLEFLTNLCLMCYRKRIQWPWLSRGSSTAEAASEVEGSRAALTLVPGKSISQVGQCLHMVSVAVEAKRSPEEARLCKGIYVHDMWVGTDTRKDVSSGPQKAAKEDVGKLNKGEESDIDKRDRTGA
ncbi:hypothetical protein NDU88_003121 [Pleurodeles waltl]|uniref:Uncharacterized protein n=1 Tax=Pleurodeles waltl TaxID=8319 RepID=A0AAV7W4R2_PLEWA|nr:hypothetical protein NDU88_003121 [Pleurodeles waltl]